VIRRRPAPNAGESSGAREKRTLTLELGSFAWQSLDEECERLGMAIEELIAFGLMYYVADADSGRIARKPPSARFDGREG
jgi:hypothetical protein